MNYAARDIGPCCKNSDVVFTIATPAVEYNTKCCWNLLRNLYFDFTEDLQNSRKMFTFSWRMKSLIVEGGCFSRWVRRLEYPDPFFLSIGHSLHFKYSSFSPCSRHILQSSGLLMPRSSQIFDNDCCFVVSIFRMISLQQEWTARRTRIPSSHSKGAAAGRYSWSVLTLLSIWEYI